MILFLGNWNYWIENTFLVVTHGGIYLTALSEESGRFLLIVIPLFEFTHKSTISTNAWGLQSFEQSVATSATPA